MPALWPLSRAREVTLTAAGPDRVPGLDRRAHRTVARSAAPRPFPRRAGGRR
jgi:hypothetical protein